MPRLLKHIWFVTPAPDTVVQSIDTLMEKYEVEVLRPAHAFGQHAIPDLILLHFTEHSASEYELLLKLKRHASASQIVVLGNDPEPVHVIDAYNAGASGYELLPIKLEDIAKKIQAIPPLKRWMAKLRHFLSSPKPHLNGSVPRPLVTITPLKQEADLYVQFLGKFVIKDNQHRALELKSTRIQSLLACLLYHGHRGVSSDRLIDNFWPEVPDVSARNSLHVAISQLRTLLRNYFDDRELIILDNNHYRICSTLSLSSDVADFESWVGKKKNGLASQTSPDEMTTLLRGVEIYQGDFLTEFKFQDWTAIIRDNLWERYLYALGTLVGYYLEQKQYQETIRFAKLLLQQDACHELTHRQLMYAYYQLGKRTSAIQQYLACKSILQADLHVAPSTETEELYQIIVKQESKKISFPLI